MKITVKKGSSPIEDITGSLEHWAVGFGFPDGSTIWYDIQGTAKKETGTPNKIISHVDDDKYSNKEDIGSIERDNKDEFLDEMDDWNRTWLKANPIYEITDANCQKHYQDFCASKLNKKVVTQNLLIGGSIVLAGLAVVVYGLNVMGEHWMVFIQ
jgi:hypothetical protein